MDLLTVLTVVRMNSVTVSAASVSKGLGGKPFRLHDRRTVSTAAVRQYIRPGDCRPASNLSIDDFANCSDGANCRADRLCARCPQTNDPRPRSSFTTKAHFNSQRSKRRLRPAKPAGQRSGRSWPAGVGPRCVSSRTRGSDLQ
jgi:hypothetical protein